MIGYLGSKKFQLKIVDANIDDQNFVQYFDCYLDSTKKVVLVVDFNLFFDASLEGLGGNPTLKKKSISKVLQLIEQHKLSEKNIFQDLYKGG